MQLRVHYLKQDGILIELEGALDMETVPDVRRRLRKAVRKRAVGSVTMDVSGVEKLDTAGVALLVELVKSASDRGIGLEIKGLGERARKMVRLARLDSVFELGNSPQGH